MKKRLIYILPPAAVLALLFAVYAKNGLYPAGFKSLSWCDMTQQVVPLLADLKDILSGKADMFLNMGNAGGMDFIGIFFFFLASPFSFLVAFVDKAGLLTFVNVLVAAKMALCSFTAMVFFKKAFPGLRDTFTVALSVMYAFSGFALMFYQNLVWLDMMCLFPLLLLSLKAVVTEKKLWPYTVLFSAVLIVNYYLSYMVALFILTGFSAYVFFLSPKEERREHILRLTIGTVYAVLITSAVWLPALLQYLDSARGGSVITNLKITPLLFNIQTKLPILYCTGVMLPVLILFTRDPLVDRPYKKFLIALFTMLVIPVILEPVNIMWHAGSYSGFPVRYGYMTAFMALIMAAFVLKEKTGIERSDLSFLWIAAGITIECAIFSVLWLIDKYEVLTTYTRELWGTEDSLSLLTVNGVVFAVSYGILLFFYKFRKLTARALGVFLLILMAFECFFNGSVYIGSHPDSVRSYGYVMELEGQIEETGFYRVKTDRKYFPSNLTGALGYNSLSHYTSLTNKDYMRAMKLLGYSSYWMEVNSPGGTLFSDSLLCNKYVITGSPDTVYSDIPVVMTQRYNIFENPRAMPLGIVTGRDLSSRSTLPEAMRMDVQQHVYESLFEAEQPLVKGYAAQYTDNVKIVKGAGWVQVSLIDPGEPGTIQYIVDVTDEEILYFDCYADMGKMFGHPILDSVGVMVDGYVAAGSYPGQDENGILELGSFHSQQVVVDVTVFKDFVAQSFGLWGLNTGALDALPEQEERLKVEGNRIYGTVEAAKDGENLFVAVPYLDGFTAVCNGEPVEVQRVFDAFMAIPLVKGENNIELTYVSNGVVLGCILSAAGLIASAFSIWVSKRNGYRLVKFLERPAALFFVTLFLFAMLAVYVVPLVIKALQ